MNCNNTSSNTNGNIGSRLLLLIAFSLNAETALPIGKKLFGGTELVARSKALQETKAMKRIGYIYEKIIAESNCIKAILNASQGKRDRWEVQEVLSHIEIYAKDLSLRLQELLFTTPYKIRMITDGLSGKERELQIPAFYPDQCAHHAIVQILKPIVEKSSYYWSCANIPKRGIDRACRGVERATVRDLKHAKYCVKLDIKKFYPSIPHDKLKQRLREVIKDRRALEIIDVVIDSYPQNVPEDTEDVRGIPIGNFPSPWFAELYLQPLDMFIKQELGIRHYIRYADDMVLIDSNKRKLRKAMYAIIEYVKGMGLTIKENYQLFRIQENGKGRKIDLEGRCFGRGFTTIRKRRALALMRQSRKIQKLQKANKPVSFHMAAGFLSRSSCFRHTDSYGMKLKYYDTVNIRKLKEVIRYESKRRQQAQCC